MKPSFTCSKSYSAMHRPLSEITYTRQRKTQRKGPVPTAHPAHQLPIRAHPRVERACCQKPPYFVGIFEVDLLADDFEPRQREVARIDPDVILELQQHKHRLALRCADAATTFSCAFARG